MRSAKLVEIPVEVGDEVVDLLSGELRVVVVPPAHGFLPEGRQRLDLRAGHVHLGAMALQAGTVQPFAVCRIPRGQGKRRRGEQAGGKAPHRRTVPNGSAIWTPRVRARSRMRSRCWVRTRLCAWSLAAAEIRAR